VARWSAHVVPFGLLTFASTPERLLKVVHAVYFGPFPRKEVAVEICTSFTVAVPEETLVDLRDRLHRTRFIDDFEGSEWTYGVSRSYLQELCEYWRTTFDWCAQEAILNSFEQFRIHVDGQRIHFIHARSPNPAALPLLLVHGWPGSIFEFVKVIGPLCDPVAHGGDASDAFHVVSPSIPGYGFSGPTIEPGWGPRRIASAFAVLMDRLGYERYGAGGGDWGAIITTELARADEGRRVCGLKRPGIGDCSSP
jgi:epoxide hydrolase